MVSKPSAPTNRPSPRRKTPRLGRYDGIAAQLLRAHDPQRTFVQTDEVVDSPTRYGAIDLFAGAGGMSLGFEMAGFRVGSAVEVVEIAAETHRRNFPECDVYCGDIADFDPTQVAMREDIRVVVGGPPCQGFSVAGRRDPNDPRNRLFREFVRVVDAVQPDYFVMENVPGILTMKGGKVRDAIVEAFTDIGYGDVSIAVLEAATFGIAQIRARAIFVGNRHGMRNPFPAPMLATEQYVPIEDAIGDLPPWTPVPEINHEWTRHSEKFMARIAEVPPGGSLYETFMDAYKRQYSGVPSMTIKENHGGTHIHPTLNRCISAREMARLQSFPDDFIFAGPMKKAMWQIGNAVPPLMGRAIGTALRPFVAAIDAGVDPEYEEWLPPGAEAPQASLF